MHFRCINMLLPQTHSPEVDYSLFIMETMEMSLGEMETTLAALRRSFPPPICSSRSLFWCFCVSAGLFLGKHRGTIFIVILGQDEYSRRKIDSNGATRAELVGPTRPRNLAAWAYLFWPSDFYFFASFAPRLFSINFQVIWTSFGSLKLKNIENRVFC